MDYSIGGFTKLKPSIVTSSVWAEADDTFRLWIYMLATANSDGFVEGTIPGLAVICRSTVQRMAKMLSILAAPDKHSRTPDHEGRRIKAVKGGWVVLNRTLHRDSDAHSPDAEGYVYFIQAGEDGPIKGGFSANPWARLKQLQEQHPEQYHLIAQVKCSRRVAMDFAASLSTYKLDREWFRPDPVLLSLIHSFDGSQLPVATGSATRSYPSTTNRVQRTEDRGKREERIRRIHKATEQTLVDPSDRRVSAAELVLTPKPTSRISHGDVLAVFDYWKQRFKKGDDHKLTADREKKIRTRLKEGYTVDFIKRAIDGNAMSPFHNGENEHGQEFHELKLICRTGSDLERFADMALDSKPARVDREKQEAEAAKKKRLDEVRRDIERRKKGQ